MLYEEDSLWERAKSLLVSWGWVIGFVSLSFFSYAHASKKKQENYRELKERVGELLKIKEEAIALREELCLEIQSQSDPKWIELTLMKGLGLVPKGKKKVLFDKEAQ
jgi:hypothetical protein